jgi:hypothetical protein
MTDLELKMDNILTTSQRDKLHEIAEKLMNTKSFKKAIIKYDFETLLKIMETSVGESLNELEPEPILIKCKNGKQVNIEKEIIMAVIKTHLKKHYEYKNTAFKIFKFSGYIALVGVIGFFGIKLYSLVK